MIEEIIEEEDLTGSEIQTAEKEALENDVSSEAPTARSEDVTDTGAEEAIDYDALISEDIAALKREFPELSRLTDITELDNPLRYATLRDLGLTPKEAYLATSRPRVNNTRSHLFGAAPKSAGSPGGAMTEGEMEKARELFSDMSDDDIRRLYRKVTK